MNDAAPALIWCPFGSVEDARAAAATLVTERLVACANILPQIVSVFAWQGAVQEEQEVGMLCKTQLRLLAPAIARLAQLHPYDTPAILGWKADEAPPATLAWLEGALAKGVGE